MQKSTARWIVAGRVQGVFFRAWTREQAESLGLDGWVRNLPDGSVEILAQGDPDRLEQLERRLHEGPSAAHVTGVEREDAAEPPDRGGFHIRH